MSLKIIKKKRIKYITNVKEKFIIQNSINVKTLALKARVRESKKNLGHPMTQSNSSLSHSAKTQSNFLLSPQQNSNVTEILTLSIQLKYCKEIGKLKETLANFYQIIKSTNYKLHYCGGETINYDGKLKKVPAHIKKMLQIYEENISAEESLEYYQSIWESMSAVAVIALRHKSFQVRLFGARDLKTDHIYQVIAAGYPLRNSWIATPVLSASQGTCTK